MLMEGRARDEFERQIYDDLTWLGLEWEEPVWKQSAHMVNYANTLRKLDQMGLLYPCFASRAQIKAHPLNDTMPISPDGLPVYPGIFRDYPKQQSRTARQARGTSHPASGHEESCRPGAEQNQRHQL